MSTLTVTTINTANATTNLTLSTGNTSAGGIRVLSSGGLVAGSNSTTNNISISATGTVTIGPNSSINSVNISATGNVGIGNSAPAVELQIDGNYGISRTNLAVGNNHNVNCALGNYFVITCNSSAQNVYFTSAPANTVYSMTLRFANGAGGNTLSWANTPRWPGGSAQAPSASTNTDIWVFFTDDGGTTWRGNLIQKDSR